MLLESPPSEASYPVSQKTRQGHGQQLQLVVTFTSQSLLAAHLRRFPAV